jgi:MFS family permease
MNRLNPLRRLREVRREFPGDFWTLIIATFIDRLGGALLFPFFALYITQKFDVGMTQVGYLFAIFSIASLIGGVFSGALTDKLGRKWMLIFGLTLSAMSSLTMGFVDQLQLFYLLAGVVGLLANAGGPAQQAMVADLLPEEKRPQGYGLIRVVANLAITIGPAIGGLLAAQSYLYLFFTDAITSLITAGIVYFILPETRPEPAEGEPTQSFTQTMGGYRRVLRDSAFLGFLAASILMIIVYMQMNSTLSVYLRDVHGVSEQGFGYILSLNAGMVVAFQFWISRRLSGRAPLSLMAVGSLLYAFGFGLYGVVANYTLFLLAMVVITIGEMIVVPTGQTLVAQMSPADMRGRYMAFYSMSWAIPSTLGPLLAGLIMDNYDPRWVWYAAATVGLAAAAGFASLQLRASDRLKEETPAAEPSI